MASMTYRELRRLLEWSAPKVAPAPAKTPPASSADRTGAAAAVGSGNAPTPAVRSACGAASHGCRFHRNARHGGHEIWHCSGGKQFSVPKNLKGEGTLQKILKDAGIRP